MLSFLDQVSGETNKVGRQRVDYPDYLLKVGAVAFVMEVGEMEQPMRGLALAKAKPADFQPFRLKQPGVGCDQ
jgi:hypothetical protein